ncbi:MAG: helix-turn-helix transcriptional regulator [Pseudomonadota bacterium]|nr:helix-turn-helix transcriptional regulator [Pseudomonadota bacterium]
MVNEETEFSTSLNQVLAAAKSAGIDQRELAQRAGIRPETLSRLKRKGRGDFDTLDRMARVVGKRLTLVADNDLTARIERGDLL